MHERNRFRGRDAAAQQGSKESIAAAAPAPVQIDLLAELPAAPLETSLTAAIARGAAYVQGVKARRCCRRCGESQAALLFVHRRQHARDREVARLVRWGVSTARLGEEIARCDVYCRRCWLAGTWNPTPQMLRMGNGASVALVAKGPIARCGGRKPAGWHSREGWRKRA